MCIFKIFDMNILNKMKTKHIIKAFSILSGCIFLVSGIGKSLATADFAELILLYEFGNFGFVSPLIAVAEIVLGLFLIFSIYPKQTSFVAILFLLLVSVIYVYGYFRHDISDCSCFGKISALNKTSPVQIIVRNFLIAIMLGAVCKYSEMRKLSFAKWKSVVIACAVGLSAFFAGHSYLPPYITLPPIEKMFENKHISETPLSNLIETSQDSTYLVFVFSYSCFHCLNSIENLKQYENTIVDRVIGISMQDSVNEIVFRENFNVDFLIKNFDDETVFSLVQGFPTSFYIRNDSIKKELVGELPFAYYFKKLLNY